MKRHFHYLLIILISFTMGILFYHIQFRPSTESDSHSLEDRTRVNEEPPAGKAEIDNYLRIIAQRESDIDQLKAKISSLQLIINKQTSEINVDTKRDSSHKTKMPIEDKVFSGKLVSQWAQQLYSDNRDQYSEAISVLNNAGPDAAIAIPDIIYNIRNDNNRMLQFPLCDVLVRIGEPAVDDLINWLRTTGEDGDMLLIIEVLSGIGDKAKKAIPSLIELMRKDEKRSTAIGEALYNIGVLDEEQIQSLFELLRSNNWPHRRGSATALRSSKLGDNRIDEIDHLIAEYQRQYELLYDIINMGQPNSDKMNEFGNAATTMKMLNEIKSKYR